MIFLCTRQSADKLGLILTYIITIISNYFLKFLYTNFSFLCKLIEILSQMLTITIILNKCMLQLIQLVHIHIFTLKLANNIANILIQSARIIKWSYWLLKFPLFLLFSFLVSTTPARCFMLMVHTFGRVCRLGLCFNLFRDRKVT